LLYFCILPAAANAQDARAAPPLSADLRDTILREIVALAKNDERKVPNVPAQEATPERIEALFRAPGLTQLPKLQREYALTFAARGETMLFAFDKPSDVLARVSSWFPEEIAKARTSGDHYRLGDVYFSGPHNNWTTEAIAFVAVWNCMPVIAWLKPDDNPFMRRWNDGGRRLDGQAALGDFEFSYCIRERSGHQFSLTMEQHRKDQEVLHQMADRISPVLRAKFSRFLAANRCRGTGPDDCVMVLRLWASLAPDDANLARTIQMLETDIAPDSPLPELRNPGATWQTSAIEDGQSRFDAGLRRAAFLRAKLLSVLRAPGAWPGDALAETFRQMSNLRLAFAVVYTHRWYQYKIDYYNEPINPWNLLPLAPDEQPKVRKAIVDELSRLDEGTPCEVVQEWFGRDKSLQSEYALQRLTMGRTSKCAAPDWDWLRKGLSAKAVEVRDGYLRLFDRPDSGKIRETVLSRLTQDGELCFARSAEPSERWLRSLCTIWISEPPLVPLKLAHSGLALDNSTRFNLTTLEPPQQQANDAKSKEQEAWFGQLTRAWGADARQKMQAIAADLSWRGVGVMTARQWTHPGHDKSLLELHLNDNQGTRLLLVVDAQDLVAVEAPDRFRGEHEYNEIVEVSDLDGDGDLELWWAESFRRCTGDTGDLQRDYDCAAKTALMGEVQGSVLSYFTRSSPAKSATRSTAGGDTAPRHVDEITRQDDRPCNRLLVGSVLGDRLKLDFGAEDEHHGRGDIIDLVCKPHPVAPGRLVVALFHDLTDVPEQPADESGADAKGFVLAVIDLGRKKVLSLYRERIEQDATTRIGEFGLHIDTARYNLKPGVRALGVRMNISYSPRCAEGGDGNYLNLFIEEGRRLRPLLKQFPMSSWSLVEGSGACANDDSASTTDSEELTLGLAASSTDGWRDLDIVSHHTIDKSVPGSDSGQQTRLPPRIVGRLRMKGNVYVREW
jgi:hypothetical protein